MKKIKRRAAHNHELRHVGEKLCRGLYYALKPRDGAEWELFDERRTFAEAYRQTAKEAAANERRTPEDRRVIPSQAPLADEAAEQRRAARQADAAARRVPRRKDAGAAGPRPAAEQYPRELSTAKARAAVNAYDTE